MAYTIYNTSLPYEGFKNGVVKDGRISVGNIKDGAVSLNNSFDLSKAKRDKFIDWAKNSESKKAVKMRERYVLNF